LGQFLIQPKESSDDGANFVKELRSHFDKLRPIDGTRHGERHPFVFKELKKADYIFLRHDGLKEMLQLSYDSPFAVVTRDDKNFTICVHDKNIMVSIDRIKPAYLFTELLTYGETINNKWLQNQTHSTATQTRSQDNERVTDQEKSKSSQIPGRTEVVMRAGRRIRFPE